jgi:osmoprotectant transport system substrate-binding protein
MRNSRSGVAGAIVLALALFASACGSSGDDTKKADTTGDTTDTTAAADEGGGGTACKDFKGSGDLTVGSTNFSEQEIVAEIYAQCLKAAGFNADTKLKIGSREIVLPALERGDIDLYPEYVGTVLTFLGGKPTPNL